MFNQLWALFLILICGINAISVNGTVDLSDKEHESVSVVSLAETLQAAPSTGNVEVASASHFPGDGHEGDCGTQQQPHTCHLGHCTFLMTSVFGLVIPDRLLAIQNHHDFSFLSAELSGPIRPPRA